MSEKEFLAFAAQTIGVSPRAISLETVYESIPEWDSMAQLRLVMEMAKEYGVEVPFSEVTQVRSLWEFWRRLNALPVKKAVAVDLDNTLWRGVVGEDGVEGIAPVSELQHSLKSLKERGVLLVALSKNSERDALDGIAGNGGPLSLDDFVAHRFNWESKADNLIEVAKELNISTDAFVFVDDNPVERLEMAAKLPGVRVAEFPPVVEAYFTEGAITAEDRVKTEQYRAEAMRKDYLGDLEVWTEVHRLRREELPRVAQLSQKANQFNVCTNRYAETDLDAGIADGKFQIFTAHAGDRFGEHGLIAFVVIGNDGEILDFVMSCRVMGRGIEERFWKAVEEELKRSGLGRVSACWRDSGRNEPVRNLFDRLGFVLVVDTEKERRYERILG